MCYAVVGYVRHMGGGGGAWGAEMTYHIVGFWESPLPALLSKEPFTPRNEPYNSGPITSFTNP